ncbi:uncharacterized protein LOC144576635 [Callithrix jacchus]
MGAEGDAQRAGPYPSPPHLVGRVSSGLLAWEAPLLGRVSAPSTPASPFGFGVRSQGCQTRIQKESIRARSGGVASDGKGRLPPEFIPSPFSTRFRLPLGLGRCPPAVRGRKPRSVSPGTPGPPLLSNPSRSPSSRSGWGNAAPGQVEPEGTGF